jgi:hypothetical protein
MTMMSPVMNGNVCCGFILRRFNAIEAFDADDKSAGNLCDRWLRTPA